MGGRHYLKAVVEVLEVGQVLEEDDRHGGEEGQDGHHGVPGERRVGRWVGGWVGGLMGGKRRSRRFERGAVGVESMGGWVGR